MTRFYTVIGVRTLMLLFVACTGVNSTDNRASSDTTTNISQSLLPDDHLLVPGKSAGYFVLNDADSTVINQLGPPAFADAAMGKAVSIWYPDSNRNQPLSIFTSRDMGNDETARIQQIRIASPDFRTVQAIGVGSPLREISDAYPLQLIETYDQDGQTYTLYNANEGIAFEVDSNYRCVAVIIHHANANIPTYLPLRPSAAGPTH